MKVFLTFASSTILLLSSPVAARDGYCSTVRCEGRDVSTCSDYYGCSTYEKGTSMQGDHGSVDTITSTVGKRCGKGGLKSCYKDFKTESACNAQSNCKWIPYGDEEEVEVATNTISQPTCESIKISYGCDGTYMGTIAGLYKPIPGSSCNGHAAYTNEDESRTLMYRGPGRGWWTGPFCNENSCDCLAPSIAYIADENENEDLMDDTEVECYDGGNGSSKKYDYTDLSIRCIQGQGASIGSNASVQIVLNPVASTAMFAVVAALNFFI